jgi:hypothetical protein
MEESYGVCGDNRIGPWEDSNPNGQRLVRKTTDAGTDHHNYIWILDCAHCGHEYGANGSDFHHRKCPKCQGGSDGLYDGVV